MLYITVKSIKGMFCFDSLIACRCNCCLKNICNSSCWQLNYTTVTLSRLFKNNKLNETSQIWELISYSHSPPTNCASSFFENRERNVLKLRVAAAQSLHLVGEPDQSLSWYLCQHALIKMDERFCHKLHMVRPLHFRFILLQSSKRLYLNAAIASSYQQLISNTTSCSRLRPRVRNHKQCNWI